MVPARSPTAAPDGGVFDGSAPTLVSAPNGPRIYVTAMRRGGVPGDERALLAIDGTDVTMVARDLDHPAALPVADGVLVAWRARMTRHDASIRSVLLPFDGDAPLRRPSRSRPTAARTKRRWPSRRWRATWSRPSPSRPSRTTARARSTCRSSTSAADTSAARRAHGLSVARRRAWWPRARRRARATTACGSPSTGATPTGRAPSSSSRARAATRLVRESASTCPRGPSCKTSRPPTRPL